jgi:hypothetical protein
MDSVKNILILDSGFQRFAQNKSNFSKIQLLPVKIKRGQKRSPAPWGYFSIKPA